MLETSRLWREVVVRLAPEYATSPSTTCSSTPPGMLIVQDPVRFDTIVTENTFGDILSDVAAGRAGGLGLAASASLADGGPGVFEPVHGSAPDIAGRGIANPAAMLCSVALMLRHGAGEPGLAAKLDEAVDAALDLDTDAGPRRDGYDGHVHGGRVDALRS